jgi:hypothetical protein
VIVVVLVWMTVSGIIWMRREGRWWVLVHVGRIMIQGSLRRRHGINRFRLGTFVWVVILRRCKDRLVIHGYMIV